MRDAVIAGIEAGGTKFLCALARPDGTVLAQERVATGEPDATFAAVARFYAAATAAHGPVAAGGIASFGPLDLDRASPSFGRLTTTPKPGWSGVDIRGRVAAILAAPTVIDTDVNCAALAEIAVGAAQGLDRICYVTVGTGIGVGMVENGRTNAGAAHAEAGHIRVPRAPGDTFAGTCPAHGDCLEGLACGPAMRARWGVPAEDLPDDHPAWQMATHYIATLCTTLTYTVRPQRIVIGGGVMERSSLLGRVRIAYDAAMAGYAPDRFCASPETYLVAPHLRDPSPGLLGAIRVAGAAARTGATA